jgi:hypothetical protein
MIQGGIFAATTALLLIGLSSVSCGGKGEETFDNIDSRVNCREYCVKKADCNDEQASGDETQVCVDACRDSIEDECGNDHQADANDKIGECVDMACNEFWDCMAFDVAPECFGFVDG